MGGGNPKRDLKTLLKNSGLASVNIIGISISFFEIHLEDGFLEAEIRFRILRLIAKF